MASGKVGVLPFLGGLAYTEVGQTVNASTTYTCPVDGWYILACESTASSSSAYFRIGESETAIISSEPSNGRRTVIPMRAGTVISGRSGSSYTQTVIGYFS